MTNRAALLNAFVPSSSMDDPARFSGRAQEVKDLADSLQILGSVPLIYGQRGLGKSSLAIQMSRIAQGDVELLTELDAEDRKLVGNSRFITFYITCEDSTHNLNGLLKLMINAIDRLKWEQRESDPGNYELVDKKTTKRLSLKLFQYEVVKNYDKSKADRDLSGLSLSEKLVELTETLTDVYQQPVLFIVDELDRLQGVKKLASFLKANSSTILKFALVGIATTEGELLRDHQSLLRQLVPVHTQRMKNAELESIVEQTETFLADEGFAYSFSSSAKDALARLASGFPWFVHIIGQRALIDADEAGHHEITKKHIDEAVSKLGENKMAQVYHDLYQKAVRDSAPRERILQLFSLWPDTNIPTSEMYPLANKVGVGAPANYVGHLTQDQCGGVLAKAPQQTRALYYFPDEMFKVYVRIRPALFEGVREETRAAFRARYH